VIPAPTTGGLVDAHVHLTLDLAGAGLPDDPAERVRRNLALLERSGVVAVRDAGSRDGLPEPLPAGRGVAAGRFLAPAGGHLAHLLVPTPPAALVDEVEAQARAGTPWIKLIADFPGPDGDWFAPRINYEPALVARAVAAAHAHGARVMAHVSGPVVGDLVRAGVDSIEHGPMIEAPLLEEMARRGTLWCPTIATIERHLLPIADVVPEVARQVRRWATVVPLAVELGIPVLAGSDELGPLGLGLELDALQRLGGLRPEQVAHAAGDGARVALGLELSPPAPPRPAAPGR
jgi:imidazolonepropionase-like amidohydrolase